MSTLKADTVTTKSDNTDLTITGGGTGVPNLEAGFKVGGTVGVPISGLQVGTDGELITWDASGDPAAVAVGTATHVLTSNGAGAAPTFQAAGGGAWSVKASGTVSTSATLAITGLTKTTQIWLDGIVSDDGVGLKFRTSSDGGSSYDSTSGDYARLNWTIFATGGSSLSSNTTDTEFDLLQMIGNATGESFAGNVVVFNPTATHKTNMTGYFASSPSDASVYQGWFGVAQRLENAIVDAVEFSLTAGTFTFDYVVLELN